MEYFEEHATDETMKGLTRNFSELSLGSFEVIDLGEPIIEDAQPSEAAQASTTVVDTLVYVTRYGLKYHYFSDCDGLNGNPTFTTTLSKVEGTKPLCLICKKRQAEELLVQNTR